ncbi:hypothetical protein WN51_10439 [Melipona quadrifasciata]|uniref:Uncharacterized protein n=1 Tax=Melipona quadrifasciata TaxID=166423 RepID=A0A0M9A4G7_9HYME|nr:hypothetical protein WN51_10439 [Melipona quadrifasciata]
MSEMRFAVLHTSQVGISNEGTYHNLRTFQNTCTQAAQHSTFWECVHE